MTPQERHQDAVAAAQEWSAEQREREPMPKVGALVRLRWPGGEHDFLMKFEYEDARMLGVYPGWHWLHGYILEPPSWYGRSWSFMVHRVDGRWTLLPKNGKISDVEP